MRNYILLSLFTLAISLLSLISYISVPLGSEMATRSIKEPTNCKHAYVGVYMHVLSHHGAACINCDIIFSCLHCIVAYWAVLIVGLPVVVVPATVIVLVLVAYCHRKKRKPPNGKCHASALVLLYAHA